MKKIVFICPYFGKIPKEQMELWLKTCKFNPNVDWIIITDDKTSFEYPKNVKTVYTTLVELKKIIQRKFDFNISLESAYKLCDFKPTYGYIFQDMIKDYDYWGHCDLSDSIFGNIEDCLDDILNKNYDKIGFLGHLTLYRNQKEINERFFLQSKSGKKLEEILGTTENMAFDETNDYSINFIYKDNGYKFKRIDDLYVDISTRSFSFRRSSWNDDLKWIKLLDERYIFEWDNGKLYKIYLINGIIHKDEILYVHYQKRKIEYNLDIINDNHFYLIPNKFIKIDSLNNNIVKKYTKNKLINKDYIKIKLNKIKKKLKG